MRVLQRSQAVGYQPFSSDWRPDARRGCLSSLSWVQGINTLHILKTRGLDTSISMSELLVSTQGGSPALSSDRRHPDSQGSKQHPAWKRQPVS